MWLDESHRRLFVGCRRPAKLLVLDTDSGATVASLDCVGDADDLFYDEPEKRIYVIGGDGAISVIDQVDADHYRQAGEMKTAPGAGTVTVRIRSFTGSTSRCPTGAAQRRGNPCL